MVVIGSINGLVMGDVGSGIITAIGNGFSVLFNFIPTLIGALLVLLIGWLIARAIEMLVMRLLHTRPAEQVLDRSGVGQAMARGGVRTDPARILAGLAFWFVFLMFVLAAAKALNLDAITSIVNAILLFLPNLFVALLVLVFGMLVGRFVGEFVRSSLAAANISGSRLLGALAQYAIIGFALIIALTQIGIGSTIIETFFAALVFGLALAGALAFGLGGRETAQNMVSRWYTSVANRQQTPAGSIPAPAATPANRPIPMPQPVSPVAPVSQAQQPTTPMQQVQQQQSQQSQQRPNQLPPTASAS